MATYNNGDLSGKIGDVIHSSWHGRPYTKRKYKGIKLVLAVAAMVLYLIFIKEGSKAFIIVTAASYLVALVAETCVYNHYFKKLNKDCYGPDGIDYARVKISQGYVGGVHITSAEVDAEGNLSVRYDGGYMSEESKDKFYLFVFCADQREGSFIPPVPRSAGVVNAQIPVEWRGHTLHLYGFMRDRKCRTSDTIYYKL